MTSKHRQTSATAGETAVVTRTTRSSHGGRGSFGGRTPHGGKAFTLVELIVVVAILAGLVAILLPLLNKATGKAQVMRLASDLQAIGAGLDAYKLDFGDYPRVDYPTYPGTATQVLVKALLSPGPHAAKAEAAGLKTKGTLLSTGVSPGPISYYMAQRDTSVTPSGDSDDWLVVPIPTYDGANGPGFRLRVTPEDAPQGKVWGPYLESGKFNLGLRMQLLDSFGTPILYFPARAGVPTIFNTTTAVNQNVKISFPKNAISKVLVTNPAYVGSYVGPTGAVPLFNLEDNRTVMEKYVLSNPKDADYLGTSAAPDPAKMRAQFQYRLQQAGEFKGPYVLWSAGPDRLYFTEDDVLNVTR